MSGNDFKEAEKEKVQFKVVSEESTCNFALEPIVESEDEPAVEQEPAPTPAAFAASEPEIDPKPALAFEKLEIIGSGAMGTVWKVRERTSGKIFAFKYIIPDLASDPNTIKRFEQEAKVAVDLHHPNLAAVYGSGVDDDGQPFIQMQYVEGESLAEILAREGKLSIDRAEDIFNQICEAVKYLHAHGVIHRDIKPSNIIVGKTASGADLVSVTDFGISKSIYEDVQPTYALTQTSDVLGSFLYSSPEQCMGEELTPSSDIYSLGCVFYEMLTGQPPFNEKNSGKLIMKQMSEQPDYDKVPPRFRLMMTYCLSKDPKSRARTVENLFEINQKLTFTGNQYNHSAGQMFPYLAGFIAILASFFSATDTSDIFALNLYATIHSLLYVMLWILFVYISRIHSIRSNFLKSTSSVFLALVPLSYASTLTNLIPYPLSVITNISLLGLLVFLSKYFENRDFSNKLVDAYLNTCNSKFFLNHTVKAIHQTQFVVAFSVFFMSAIGFFPTVISWYLLGDPGRVAIQTVATLFLGLFYTLFVFQTISVEAETSQKNKSAAIFSIKSFGISLAILLIPFSFLWTNATGSIIKLSSSLYVNAPISKSLLQEVDALPKDDLGNYARIMAIQKLIRQRQEPARALSYVNEVVNSQKKSSQLKAMAFAYKDVLNRRIANDEVSATPSFEEALIEFSESKSKINFSHPKILLADLLNFGRLSNLPDNSIYYMADEAFRNGYPEETKKALAQRKRLKMSSGDFPYSFNVLEDKIND